MVAMDDQGRPAPVPALDPQTDDDVRRQRQALQRREIRHELQQRYQALNEGTP